MSKPIITLVVAMNNERVIGVDNKLPWHIPEDLQYFKHVTLGKPIIMGRKTFESIGKILPGRKNIVISNNPNFSHAGVVVYKSLLDAINDNSTSDEICIIGGGEIFKQALPIADIIHVTKINIAVSGNAIFFPEIDMKQWKLCQSKQIITQTQIECSFNVLFRMNCNVDEAEYCNNVTTYTQTSSK